MSPLERAVEAIRLLRRLHRERSDAELASRGLWPDDRASPSDEDIARAVLTAIREPKGRMIAAGAKFSRMSTKQGREHDVLRNLNAMTIYTAMIDAALGEG